METPYDEILKNVEARDAMDSSRKDSPLMQAKDAVVIDNSNLNRDEQFAIILDLAKQKIEQ